MSKNVSIIVSCYNRDDIVEKCIINLLNLSYNYGKYEIIAVDDGSSDDTGKILDRYKDRINVIHHKENSGLAAARNSGIENSRYDLLAFLDCDMIVDKDWLNNFIDELFKEDEIIGVFGNNRFPYSLKKATKYEKYLYSTGRGARKYGENIPIYYKYFLFNNTIIKKFVFDEVGLFDNNIGYYGEDTDMSLRIWKKYPDGFRFSFKAYSYHYHFRKLEDMEKTMDFYGYNKLPILYKKHPEYVKDFGINIASSLWGRLTFNSFFKGIAKRILKFIPYPLSNFFIKYIISTSAFIGYRRQLNKK